MHLREATEAEKIARDRDTAEAWGERLTVDQFVEREVRLRSHRWAKANMQTWFWVDERDTVLSSCEAFEIPSEIGRVQGRSWGIASVFTVPALRKRGHSTAMLQALNAHLKSLSSAQSVVLFSDVGAPLYERSGYRAVSAHDVTLPARAFSTGVEFFNVVKPLPSAPSTAGVLQLLVTADQLDWHVERERAYAQLMNRPELPFHSVQFGESGATFAAMMKTDELVVLEMHAANEAEQRELLKALQNLALTHGLKLVRIWADSLLPQTQETREARDGSLPMYLPFRDGVTSWVNIHRGLWL